MTANQRATRAGFTLVEILMVIAIIAVLAALLITAVSRVRKTAQNMTVASDISQLEISLGAFKQTFNVLPPSHVTVAAGSAETTSGVTGARTTAGVYRFRMPVRNDEPEYALLQRMFPRWNPVQSGDPNYGTAPFRFKMDGVTLDLDQMEQALGGQTVPPAAPYAKLARATNPKVNTNAVPLDGNQVLVLFLGGPLAALTGTTFQDTTTPVAHGLSSYTTGWDVATPTAPLAASNTKKGPHYDIPPAKLVSVAGELVPHLVDPWGTPIAYFAASAGANYDPRVPFPWPASATDAPAASTYDGSAATSFSNDPNRTTTFTAHAYGSGGKWMKPGEYQLISAGPDRLFGPGSFTDTTTAKLIHVWDAKNPQGSGNSAVYYGEGGGEQWIAAENTPSQKPNPKLARGADDLCNFNAGSNLGTSNAP